MLICTHCGKTYEGNLPTYTEIHGYTSLGDALGETCVDDTCPFCKKGELVEATECKACGEWYYEEYGYTHICESCLEKNKTLEMALAIGEENTTDVYVNGFVKTLLGDKKINEILMDYVKFHFTTDKVKKAIVDYCDEDKYYFAEFVEYEIEHKE